MANEQEIKQHLSAYRTKHNLNQKAMAAHIGVAYATYQQMKKGIFKTLEVFKKFKEKTDFKGTHDSMYYISNIEIEGNNSNVISDSLSEMVALKAAVKVLSLKIIKIESKVFKLDSDKASLELHKTMKEVYSQLLDELHNGEPFSFF